MPQRPSWPLLQRGQQQTQQQKIRQFQTPQGKTVTNRYYRPFKALLVKFGLPIPFSIVGPRSPGAGKSRRLERIPIEVEVSSVKYHNHRSKWPTWPKGRGEAATDSNSGRKNHSACTRTIVLATVGTVSPKGSYILSDRQGEERSLKNFSVEFQNEA